jgi:solute carrier family 25 protein 42
LATAGAASTRTGEDNASWNTVKSFFAGGLSGATAKTIIAPLDRVKIIFQISNLPYSPRAVVQELGRTLQVEGFRALFRGNAAQVLRVYPYSGIQLSAFDRYARTIVRMRPRKAQAPIQAGAKVRGPTSVAGTLNPLEKLVAGAGAGATSVVLTYPLDSMRARLAVQLETRGLDAKRYADMSLMQSFQAMRQEHGLGSFYRGVTPTLLGILPYAGISFATFETLKQTVRDETGSEPTTLVRLLCGGVAGLAGQAFTYPLDIVRRRMQTEGFTPLHAHAQTAEGGTAATNPNWQHLKRAGMVETLKRIYRREGVRGFFKGFSMNVVKGPLSVGVSFTTYDLLKRLLHIEERGGHGHH